MNDTISERSKKILRALANGEPAGRSAIEEATGESRNNVIREMATLQEQGLVKSVGEARATVYRITEKARKLAVWNVKDYLAIDPDKRNVRYTAIEPALFHEIDGIVDSVYVVIENALAVRQKRGDSTATRKDLERFVIELSWKSSKIEGNTYSLLDTERLLNEGVPAQGHSSEEAVMIINHKKAFEYIWSNQADFRHLTLHGIEEIHQLLTADLNIDFGIRDEPVGITGTIYTPPASQVEIATYMRDIIDIINGIEKPLEKALACLMLLPYLQPFADGNKRTSRLVANAILIAYGYAPMSYRSVDEEEYKGSLLLFYEQGAVANFRDLYLEQLKEGAMKYYFPILSSLKV